MNCDNKIVTSNQQKTIGVWSGSMSLRLQTELTQLGLSKYDKVFVAVEENDGKKRIIIEEV